MEIYEIVQKLTGPISPVADASIDGKRLENLESRIDVMDELMRDMFFAANQSESIYGSAKAVGQKAKKWLEMLKTELDENGI